MVWEKQRAQTIRKKQVGHPSSPSLPTRQVDIELWFFFLFLRATEPIFWREEAPEQTLCRLWGCPRFSVCHTHRHTDTQTDRHTQTQRPHTQTHTQTDTQTHRQTHTDAHKRTHTHAQHTHKHEQHTHTRTTHSHCKRATAEGDVRHAWRSRNVDQVDVLSRLELHVHDVQRVQDVTLAKDAWRRRQLTRRDGRRRRTVCACVTIRHGVGVSGLLQGHLDPNRPVWPSRAPCTRCSASSGCNFGEERIGAGESVDQKKR